MGIEEKIGRPTEEHPRRPILGFDCTRSEVSGARLWGAIADHWGTPERFFADHFVANYCPLLFMEEGGRNRTPDKLAPAEKEALFAACDAHLAAVVRALEPSLVVGIGAFATGRARSVLGDSGLQIGEVLHPSPANPRANRDWKGEAQRALADLGLCGGPG